MLLELYKSINLVNSILLSTMQIEDQNVMVPEHETTILCPMCGIQFQPKLTNVC